jgi:hypothetical protein
MGDVICHADQEVVPVSQLFFADVELFELSSSKPILSNGDHCIFHLHSAVDECTI